MPKITLLFEVLPKDHIILIIVDIIYSCQQNLGKLVVLKIDQHNITSLDKDIFADSLTSQKLEKLYLSHGKLNDLPVESFQVNLRII